MSKQTTTTPATVDPFKGIRRAGTPIVGIETADPAATIVQCLRTLNGNKDKLPVVRWDIIRGITAENKPGSEYVDNIPADVKVQLMNPSAALQYIGDNPPKVGDGSEARGGSFLCVTRTCAPSKTKSRTYP